MQHETQTAVAKEHRVSIRVVNKLVRQQQKNQQLLDELVAKRDAADARRAKIAEVVR